MPFTPAHAVFAPYVDRWTRGALPLSAVALGCVTPDVEYFLHLQTVATYGHTLPGILLWDLPLGLVLLALFHGLVREPALLLLPDAHRRRLAALPGWRWGPPRRFAGICLAVVLGAASHVVLDAFTHIDGWAVERLAVLRAEVGGRLPVYKALQHGLGAAFLAVLGWLYLSWVRRTPLPQEDEGPVWPRRRRWTAVASFAILATAAGCANGARLVGGLPRSAADGPPFVVAGAIGSLSAAALLLVLLALGARAAGREPRSGR